MMNSMLILNPADFTFVYLVRDLTLQEPKMLTHNVCFLVIHLKFALVLCFDTEVGSVRSHVVFVFIDLQNVFAK